MRLFVISLRLYLYFLVLLVSSGCSQVKSNDKYDETDNQANQDQKKFVQADVLRKNETEIAENIRATELPKIIENPRSVKKQPPEKQKFQLPPSTLKKIDEIAADILSNESPDIYAVNEEDNQNISNPKLASLSQRRYNTEQKVNNLDAKQIDVPKHIEKSKSIEPQKYVDTPKHTENIKKSSETESSIYEASKSLEAATKELNKTLKQLSDDDRLPRKDSARRYQESSYRLDPFNASLWIGVGQLFETDNLSNFIKNPILNLEIGASKSLWNITPFTFLYGALIFGYGNSTQNINMTNSKVEAWYYFVHEAILFGYEQSLGTPHLSLFLEAGPVLQQTSFGIQEMSTSRITDTVAFQTYGGSFNAGFNINTNPGGLSCTIRLGASALLGPPQNVTLHYNSEKINANPLLFGPTVSIMLRK